MARFLARKPSCVLLWLLLVLLIALFVSSLPSDCDACGQDVRVLLIGSHICGAENPMTKQVLLIENFLEFNGIPYDFFDIAERLLTQSQLDQYEGVIIEGEAVYWEARVSERELIAENMRNGNITVLVGLINGLRTIMNSSIYDAIDVSVDGLGNGEANISLGDSARIIHDFDGDHGFIICGGRDFRHVGMAVTPLGEWSYIRLSAYGERVAGIEIALERWMKNAFGFDARVTMPITSLYLSDTQTTMYPRSQELIDFIADNKQRIRASGFLTTNPSAFQGSDTTLQNDERILSEWGSMVLHGRNHHTVGAEGEDLDFGTQYSDMSVAVAFLQEHFTRYKPIKGPPNLSWNEETLHAMYLNGIYFHAASLRKSPDYPALYKSVFDAADAFEREKLFVRGIEAGLRYYPLHHSDATGDAWIYSVDYYVGLNANYDPAEVTSILKRHGIDWWTPVLLATHFSGPGVSTALGDPPGWMALMDTLMDQLDHDTCPRRRWVDTYDYAKNIQRFDQDLTVNSISIEGNAITYDLTANQPVRYVTLKADSTGLGVHSVTINGVPHNYFGADYVHLPELCGNTVIVVNMSPQGDCEPHVTHIAPNAVVESAIYSDGRLALAMSGEFDATVRIADSHAAFLSGITTIGADGTEELRVDVSAHPYDEQVDLALIPAVGTVSTEILGWDSLSTGCREWLEYGDNPSAQVQHVVCGLAPNACYIVRHGSCPAETCTSDCCGEITFVCCESASPCTMSVVPDSCAAAVRLDDPSVGGTVRRVFLRSHPNPSRHGTTVSYGLPSRGRVTLMVYSTAGRLIRKLLDETTPAGVHSIDWDGCDTDGRRVPAGVYFCRLETTTGSGIHKMVLIR